jgi:hypothetical protein
MPVISQETKRMGSLAVTEFVDSVGSNGVTYTLQDTTVQQETLAIYNISPVDLLVSVGSQSNVSVPAYRSITLTESFTAFTIQSVSGVGGFRAKCSYEDADEQDEKDFFNKFTTQMADMVTQLATVVGVAGNISEKQPANQIDITPVNDTDGVKVNAHGAGIMFYNEKYYLYGESKTGTTSGGFIPTTGVNCYSSFDLVNWTNEGKVLAPNTTVPTSDIHTSKVIERPKVIYNKKNNNFVMIMHIDTSDYSYAKIGIATCNTPNGIFTYLGSSQPNFASTCRDLTVFKDDDEKAYVIVSRDSNASIYIHLLNDDYTGFTNTYANIIPNAYREAPTMFKYNNNYYLMTSGQTGWNPNPTKIHLASTIMGTYVDQGLTCLNDTNNNSYGSQPTNVVPVDETKFGYKFIAMFDKWNSADLQSSTYLWMPLLLNTSTNHFNTDINQNLVTSPEKIFDFRVDDKTHPLNGFTIMGALKYIFQNMNNGSNSANLIGSGLIFQLDSRDYTSNTATWTPRVGSSYGTITFKDPTIVTRDNKVVHVGKGGAGLSSIQPFLNGIAQYTIEVLVKPMTLDTTSVYDTYVALNSETSPWYGFNFQKPPTPNVFRLTDANATIANDYVDIQNFTSQWFNIKVVASSTDHKFYVNNSLVKSETWSNPAIHSYDGKLSIGSYMLDGRYAELEIASIRIYNRALTADELTVNYNFDNATYFG